MKSHISKNFTLRGLRVNLLLLAVVGNLVYSFSARAGFNGTLTVEIDGFKNKEGQVCASIFANSQGFPNQRDRVLQRQCTKITDIPVKITFENLPASSYAVAVMHDQNKDLILNRNSLGMPTEGFGFSRNPEVTTKPPKFSEATFLLAGPNTKVNVQLKYL
ncbi:DUF2141 domain-containing protein [Calothrix sp. PCC 7507]|uniref:DUF2141 domain-containing protein n=1 Tax=Calothrix sp. PCC 7507 TaxID=99598 RepID=UPI00029F1DBA|nr:DUF2141 domain-containing protein [Calothrix sp. PCC 7507]AFY35251.1 Protein of unknown function DUF2141 [Calothrix sp. PCC 7507]